MCSSKGKFLFNANILLCYLKKYFSNEMSLTLVFILEVVLEYIVGFTMECSEAKQKGIA